MLGSKNALSFVPRHECFSSALKKSLNSTATTYKTYMFIYICISLLSWSWWVAVCFK